MSQEAIADHRMDTVRDHQPGIQLVQKTDRPGNHSDIVFQAPGLPVGDILPYKGKLTYDSVASSFRVIT